MHKRELVRVISYPTALVAGEKTELSLSTVWAGESPKSTNFGVLPRTELLAKFILLHALTLATSPETASKSITPMKWDVEWLFMAKGPLMGVSNGLLCQLWACNTAYIYNDKLMDQCTNLVCHD